MKTVAVLYSGGRQWGGIETYLFNLFRLNDGRQVDLVLLSMGEWELTRAVTGEGRPRGGGVPLDPMGSRKGLRPKVRILSERRIRLRTVWDIRRALKEEQAGLLVSQGVVANSYARAASLLSGVPSLVVVHSDLAADYPRPLARWSYTFADRLLRTATRRYIAVARYLKGRLVASGLEAERITVIHNGVSESGATAGLKTGGAVGATHGTSFEPVPARPSRSGRRTTLVSLGRLHPVKNFEGLIEAMKLLPDEVALEIWGSGPERARLERVITAGGLQHRVRLCGEAEGVAAALAGADVYVQPSLSEGCSFAVVEAMLQGLPVVVTPCGGMPEQIEDGRTGIVATGVGPEELAEAVIRVLADPQATARLGERARQAARERFSLERWLHDTISVFAEAAR